MATTRFVGYTSDAAGSPVTITAVDVDPCTGKQTFRAVTTGAASTAAGETRMKFDQRIKMDAGSKHTREYRFATAAAPQLTRNNITAGLYVQPATEWIQPELTSPGTAPLAHDFSAFSHLTQGLGPDDKGDVWGPLDPFPQTGVAVFNAAGCPPPASTTSSAPATGPSATAAPVPADTVKVASATWSSTGGGTLSVTCTSSNRNATVVGMTVDYVDSKSGATTFNNGMTASTTPAGTWTFSGTKIKQASSAACKSKLGGSGTLTVTPRRRRSL